MTEQSGTRQPGASNPFLRARPKDAAADPTGAPGAFPQVRMRRNRSSAWSRRLVAENRLSVDDFIWPVFVQEDAGTTAVESMPGVLRYGLDRLVDAIGPAFEAGIPAVELFPYLSADVKTPDCREAVNPDNLVCRAVRASRIWVSSPTSPWTPSTATGTTVCLRTGRSSTTRAWSCWPNRLWSRRAPDRTSSPRRT
jgi:hypothetical protein